MPRYQALLNFNFRLDLDDFDPLLIQMVDTPDVSLGQVTFGSSANEPDVKQPAKYVATDMVINKIKPINIADLTSWRLFAEAVANVNGAFYRNGYLHELAQDRITPINSFWMGETWIKQISTSNYESAGEGAVLMENLTLSMRFFYPVGSNDFQRLFAGA